MHGFCKERRGKKKEMKRIYKIPPVTAAFLFLLLSGCSEKTPIPEQHPEIEGLVFEERADLTYAEQFAIDSYEGGYSLIHTMNGERFLLIPEGGAIPQQLESDITIIQQPADHIYLAATSAMGLFSELDCTDAVDFSGTRADDWYIESAREAMEQGDMLYAGKYREPDYELLLTNGCTLSVQSTMIEHSPEVKEKLTELGIPVFIDYSSYESHPLGRSEWIKVYGEMTGRSDAAEQLFAKQAAELTSLPDTESTGKTVVYFYISSAGQVITRKSGDYITKMIALAGGENALDHPGDSESASGSVTMEMEKFYTQAKDADFIIYNSTNSGEIHSIEELLAKNELLSDFKAVQNGNVWCTRENLFQETMKLGTVISDFHAIFTDNTETEPPEFLFRLESGDST